MSLIGQVLPIFLLLGLGFLSRRFGWLTDAAVDGLRAIVVRMVLPSVLFLSFVDMQLSASYLSLVAVVFVTCAVGMAAAWVLIRRRYPTDRFTPFMAGGYEFGMLGVSLFVGAYGVGALPSIAVVALGHELFIWFVFFAFLIAARDGSARPGDLALGFVKNPVTAAILIGLTFNVLGLKTAVLETVPVVDAVIASLRFLSPMVVPAVLIVVGHGLRFEAVDGGKIAAIMLRRAVVQLPLAIVVAFGVVGVLLGFETRFQVALFTLIILPPPFIVPLFMPDDPAARAERPLILQVLTIHTLASLIVFAGIIALFPTFG